jgi:4-hydroxy-tetrahydrodipicolinate synthase
MTNLLKPATWLAGYIADLPTPFDDNDRIDLSAFAQLCERQIEAGASAIVVGETAGEASTLTPAEHDAIVRTAIEIAHGRARIIAGAGSNSTAQAIELTRHAEMAGADAVLSVVPYYNKPMQAGIEAHFCAIASSTTLPIILHDIPSRTVRELSDDTLARLAQSRQFIGLRDGTGDITRPLRLRSRLPLGFRLLSGDDATALAFIARTCPARHSRPRSASRARCSTPWPDGAGRESKDRCRPGGWLRPADTGQHEGAQS